MSYRIEQIEGIGPSYAHKLAQARIKTTNDLLKSCCHASGRRDISSACDVSEAQLLKWANLADLMRVKGIGSQYSELLEAAGVDTVKELRNRNAANLAGTMKKVNEAKRLCRVTPSSSMVEGWIQSASELKPLITH